MVRSKCTLLRVDRQPAFQGFLPHPVLRSLMTAIALAKAAGEGGCSMLCSRVWKREEQGVAKASLRRKHIKDWRPHPDEHGRG